MKITIHQAGRAPLVIEGATVVVEDHNGTPISVTCQHGRAPDASYTTSHAADKDFNRVLKTLGIDKLVDCVHAPTPPLPAGARPYR